MDRSPSPIPDSTYRNEYRVRISHIRPIPLRRANPCSCRPKCAYVSIKMWWNVAARGVLGNSHDLGVLFEVAEHLLA